MDVETYEASVWKFCWILEKNLGHFNHCAFTVRIRYSCQLFSARESFWGCVCLSEVLVKVIKVRK